MDSFCEGEKIWNETLTWSNDADFPDFTECFQNTVLVGVASGWILITLPFYLPHLLGLRSEHLPVSKKHVAKLFLAFLQIVIVVIELTYESLDLRRRNAGFWKAAFVGPLVEGLTLLVVLVYLELERRKRFITSGILFLYWVLANLTFVIPFYLKIIKKEYNDKPLNFTVFNVYVALSLAQLFLSCFAEKLPDPGGSKPPFPETRASFLSRLTYQWINRLVVQGFRKPLTENDMYQLHPREQTDNVMHKFEAHWRREQINVARKTSRKHYVDSQDSGIIKTSELSESTPLLSSQSKPGTSHSTLRSQKSHDKSHDKSRDKKREISLAKVLFKTYGLDYLLANLLKLVYDLLAFVNPMLLRILIDFAESDDEPVWKGYIYCLGFLGVLVIQSNCFNMLMLKSTFLGVRVRTSLISAVFKKALTVNGRARAESTVGEIVNLMSVDAEHLKDVTSYVWALWSAPLQIILALVFLYYTVGVAVFAGVGVMVVLIPFNWVISHYMKIYQTGQMEEKDERIKLTTEVLNGIKILKLYAWEMAFGEKISEIRERELRYIRKGAIVNALMLFSWTVAPFTVGLATFATYIFMKDDHKFNAQTAFVAISLFNILKFALIVTPWMVVEIIKSAVSVARLHKFLNHEDLDANNVSHEKAEDAVTIENGTFSWDPEIGACLHDINVRIPRGGLVAVVGSVGAGKSSLLSAVLGEMDKWSGKVNVDGSIAYVPQQAWIQNATLRDNITFGQEMNATKYEEIVEACAMRSDLDILPAKDLTEIGEKGINLSGGQRQRVSLARAVYFDSDIYLLDDPLSAVDSHVGKHIFEKVVGNNGLLKNKTRILVTHGIHWLPKVEMIVVISDGMVSEAGTYDQLLEHDGAFANFLRTYLLEKEDSETEDEDDEEVQAFKSKALERLVSIQSDTPSDSDTGQAIRRRLLSRGDSQHDGAHKGQQLKRSVSRDDRSHKSHDKSRDTSRQTSVMTEKDGELGDSRAQLIEEEFLEFGNVSKGVVWAYVKALGVKFTVLIFLMYGSYQGFVVWSSIWLTNWTADPQLQNLTALPADSQARRDRNDMYLGIYGVFGIVQGVFVLLYSSMAIIRMVHAGRVLQNNLLINVLRCPMSFFDTTPTGRIVNRFSTDIEAIDSTIPHNLESFLDCMFIVLSTLVVITYSTPIFLTIIVPLAILYFFIQRFYIPTSRQLKRLESKTKSPIFNHFSEVLTGVSVIRAFDVQGRFIRDSANRVDHNQIYTVGNFAVNRWLGYRLELLSSILVLAASIFAVVERGSISSSLVGLSISYALQVTDNLNWLVRVTSELETSVVSVERVLQFSAKKTEAPLKTSYVPPVDWPTAGKVDLKSYSVRYRDGLDLVLKNITVSIKPSEKVGIVGRTGAGKSSLTLSLFRLIEPAGGKILVDGEDITHLGLFDLRSRLTILPQEPVLFSGSLRLNLDPMGDYSDHQLWEALEHAHLKSFISELPNKLEYEVGEGGQNLSVGQRQLVCLARSLLRKTKILVLDEATAAVDLETDSLIQKTISAEFQDCTVLTIAHRLNTVLDYDRILVLSEGEVVEFDSPKTLLQNADSAFYKMAKDAGLV